MKGAFSNWVAYAVSLVKEHLPPNKVYRLANQLLTLDSLLNLRFVRVLRYLIPGIPTIVMGKIIFFILPSRPETSKYLTKHQRLVALARAKRGVHPEPPQTVDKKAIKPAFLDIRIYLYSLLYMCLEMGNLALFFFLPSIVRDIGFGEMPGTALMRVPPL